MEYRIQSESSQFQFPLFNLIFHLFPLFQYIHVLDCTLDKRTKSYYTISWPIKRLELFICIYLLFIQGEFIRHGRSGWDDDQNKRWLMRMYSFFCFSENRKKVSIFFFYQSVLYMYTDHHVSIFNFISPIFFVHLIHFIFHLFSISFSGKSEQMCPSHIKSRTK